MSFRSFVLILTAMLSFASFPLISEGSDTETVISFSFDLDGDHIDDSIRGEAPLHVIVHTSDQIFISDKIKELGGSVQDTYTLIDCVSAILPTMETVEKIAETEGVVVIEKQRELVFLMDTSVPSTKAVQSSEFSPQTAHDLGYTGEGVTIAVIDTGVDNEHPMLEGSFVAGADFQLPATPLTPRDGSYDPDDRSGHGTGIASIALGREVDGLVGIAPDAGLIDLKLGSLGTVENSPRTNDLLEAFQWCSDNRETDWGEGYTGVDIISLSLGIDPVDGAFAQAIENLVSEGIVIVQGAGNSAGPYQDQSDTVWPDSSIIVGGLDHKGTVERADDVFWSGSTSGPRIDDGDQDRMDELKPDVTAPAVDLTFAAHSSTSGVQGASGISSGSGTSYATPHVSGVVALMLEANPNIRPDADSNPVKRILHQSAEARGNPTFPDLSSKYNANYGWGILDAYQAVISARSYTDTNHRPVITSFEVSPTTVTIGSIAIVRVSATDLDEDRLSYSLEVDAGTYTGEGPSWEWTAPDEPGTYSFVVTVEDTSGATDQKRTDVDVIEGTPNRPPVITSFSVNDRTLGVGESTEITVQAFDQDGDSLKYEYFTIIGSVSGEGESATYTAPGNAGTDTITVIVSDPSGASDQRDLTISIIEDITNSLPSIILLTIEPDLITANLTGTDVILKATVDDPDGLEDIDLVLADLSTLGASDGERMFDDGSYPDNTSSDGIFSLIVPLPEIPLNGVYRIEVAVIDSSGEEVVDSIDLTIEIEAAGNVSAGGSSGLDLLIIFISLGVVFVIAFIAVIFLVARGRKKKTPPVNPYSQHPYYPQVRYRPSNPQMINVPPQGPAIQVGPSSQASTKFNVVSNR
jgi:serine protease AprX